MAVAFNSNYFINSTRGVDRELIREFDDSISSKRDLLDNTLNGHLNFPD